MLQIGDKMPERIYEWEYALCNGSTGHGKETTRNRFGGIFLPTGILV